MAVSKYDKDGVVERQEPFVREQWTLGEKQGIDYEMNPGTAQDEYDMDRLGKTEQLSVHLEPHTQTLQKRCSWPQRAFRSATILGLTSTIMLTWQSMFG